MGFLDAVVAKVFSAEVERITEKAVHENDERWADAVYQNFYREGGHQYKGGTFSVRNPKVFDNGVTYEPTWGVIEYEGDATSDAQRHVTL